MSADAIRLLAELNRVGIALWAEEGQLRFRSRKGQLTTQLKAALATHREALLTLLGAAGASETAIGKRSAAAGDPVPLSAQQHAVWMAEQNGGGKAFLIPGALSLAGRLDKAALRAAFQGLLNRHEAFRTAIRVEHDQPMQVVMPAVQFEMPQIDLSCLSEIEQSARVSALLAAEAEQPFQLEIAPLLRARLIVLGSERHVLILTPHHIVADGWSIDIMVRELSQLYQPGVTLPTAEQQLGAAPLGYADFAAWQEARSRQGEDSADLAYWRSTLANLPAPLELPSERPPGSVAEFAGASLRAELPASACGGLRRLATQAGTTLFSALASAFAALLYRYSGQTDLIIGTAIAGRGRTELEGVIGLFAGRLPLRLDLDGDPSFRELLKRVAATAAEAFSHAEVPAERILSEVVAPDARAGLFQTMIALQNAVSSRLAFTGLEVQPLPISGDTAKFDLFLAIDEIGDTLALSLEYSTARFGQEGVQQLLTHLVRLACAAVDAPDLPLSRLPMLAPQERQDLLSAGGNAAHWPGPDNLWQRFSQMADAVPEQLALIAPLQWGELQTDNMTYGALHARALVVATRLLQAGMQPGEVVALDGQRSAGFIEGMLGILAAGGSYMPIAPDLPAARIAELLEDAAASLLVCVSNDCPIPATPFRAIVYTSEIGNVPGASSLEMPAIAADARAYVMFTSGSTGRPKGVEVTHANVVHFVAGMPTTPGDGNAVFLHFAPTGFDASVLEIWSALLTGARLVIAPPGLPSLDALADLIEAHQVSASFLTAGLFQQLCEVRAATLSKLDCLMAGGDRVSLNAVRAIMACGGRAKLYNGYGPTETTVIACHHEVRLADIDPAAHSLPIGKPHGNTRLYVLDRHGEPVAAGVIGELYIGGGGVAAGYINRPDLSAERFLPDPFSSEPQARMYRSGDLVRRRSDGVLDFLGRADRQLKIRGFRIEPGEIEASLNTHPAVAQAVVELKTVGGHARLVAYIVAAQPATDQHGQLDLAAMRGFLVQRLPEHMIPGALVILDSLPLTRNGKLDRAALPLPVAEVAGETLRTPPSSPESLILAGIWQDVLQVTQVGMEDNFYDLGGDSIMAMQVAMRLTRQGWELRPQEMLRHPTLQAQSTLMRRRQQAFVKRSDHGPLPATPIQNWFFNLELANRHHWNQAVRLALEPQALPGLEPALLQLEQTHEALRLRFLNTADGWLQQAVATVESSLLRVTADNQAQALAHIEAAQASLDIENGPVWRAVLVEGEHDEWPHLVLIAHHLVVDGVSWRILLEDLTLALQGKTIEAPALGITDWAAHLATSVSPAQSAAAAASSPTPALPPFDWPDGAHLEADTGIVTLQLPPQIAADLLGAANLPYRTEPTELLLAGVMLGLRDAFDRGDLSVALERHGREVDGVDLSGTVGWFTAIAPVHLALAADAGTGQALLALKQPIRQSAREMPSGGEMPAVAFNYLGRFDNSLPPGGPFMLVEESSGATSAAENSRPYPLEIVASVDNAGLRMDFRFSHGQFAQRNVEAWAAAAKLALLDVVEHTKTAAAGGRAPCDFPLAGIDTQHELDAILADNRLSASHIADLLPVSSQQRGMLLENMAHRERGLHIEQFVATFEGPLDYSALENRWGSLVARHETLRSSFIWRPAGDPLCVVFERHAAVWQHFDWSARDAASQQRDIADWLQHDSRAGFDGNDVPLRFATIRLTPESWLFIWTYHHALLDGWSVAQLLSEALDGNGSQTLPGSVRDHASWLASRNREAAAAFWQQNLAHAQTPTIPGRYVEQLAPGEGHADQRRQVPASIVQQLEQLARRHRTTPALVAQGAWALVMAWASGRRDIVFSVTVSGRPAEVAGSEAWVGLFINSLPLRLAVPATGNAWQWLSELGAVSAALTPYEWCTGGDIHSWSGLPLNRALSDTLLIFENFPRAKHQPQAGTRDSVLPQLVTVAGHGSRTRFPVTLVIVPDNGWRCELAGDNTYFPESESEKLLDAFVVLLRQLTEDNIDIAAAQAALSSPPGICVPVVRAAQAPRTPLELDLAKLWEDLFSYSPIGIDDNFFSLGGHSLLALDLMSRLRIRFGRTIPFTAFLRDPTIGSLSRLLEGDAEKGGVSLLPLGVAGQPMYLMPGASGNPLAYLPLAQILEGRIALIGAQPDMLLESGAISIEAIAAELARSIDLHQPQGTVHLAGHSFGAVVAFETARQLTQTGRHVGTLILIDTTVPDGGKEFIGYGESDWIVAISDAAASYFGRAVEIRMEQLEGLSPQQQRHLLLQRFKAAGTLPAGASVEVIDDLLLTYQRSIEALSTYQPQYWDGALSVIRSSETPAPADTALGWGVLCREISATFQAPGDHITMVTGAHAAALAELIQQSMDTNPVTTP